MQHALAVTRAGDFSAWYQAVVDQADLAEESGVRGCMIIRPWGYGVWQRMQELLDRRFRDTGHENCYFPLFIPLSYIAREAEHVEGFAKEMAVVTHHRLKMIDGVLKPDPDAKLEEPLIVRPTSETVIGAAFHRWVRSHRDLPLLLNQWANVVRWEMRTRLFLRTSEFLWQEGHTAHATSAEAVEETKLMLEVYRRVVEGDMRIPVIPGTKSAGERFPGADETHTIEAMMQDGRALQAGTSHFLGQNFARAAGIEFVDRANERQYAHTTSFGISTRLIGAVIMTHGDDDGLVLPPAVAPSQVVIVPILRGEQTEPVLAYAHEVAAALTGPGGIQPDRVLVETSEQRATDLRWSYIKKGAPVIVEVGPRDLASRTVSYRMRLDHRTLRTASFDAVPGAIGGALREVHEGLLDQARTRLRDGIHTGITTLAQLAEFFRSQRGFVLGAWCGEPDCEAALKPLAVSIRCIPQHLEAPGSVCIVDGRPRRFSALFGQSY